MRPTIPSSLSRHLRLSDRPTPIATIRRHCAWPRLAVNQETSHNGDETPLKTIVLLLHRQIDRDGYFSFLFLFFLISRIWIRYESFFLQGGGGLFLLLWCDRQGTRILPFCFHKFRLQFVPAAHETDSGCLVKRDWKTVQENEPTIFWLAGGLAHVSVSKTGRRCSKRLLFFFFVAPQHHIHPSTRFLF